MTQSYFPILIMLIIAVVIGATILGLNWVLGRHQRNPSKLSPYESGVPPLDENRKRVNVRFYHTAMRRTGPPACFSSARWRSSSPFSAWDTSTCGRRKHSIGTEHSWPTYIPT